MQTPLALLLMFFGIAWIICGVRGIVRKEFTTYVRGRGSGTTYVGSEAVRLRLFELLCGLALAAVGFVLYWATPHA